MTLTACGRPPRPEGRRRRERGRARGGRPGGWWNTCRLSVPAVVLAVAVVLPPAPAAAQEDGPGSHRKWLGAAIGAVVVGVPTFTSADFPTMGTCTRTECFAPLATAVGFTLGFLLGKEFDDGAARRFVAGPRLDLRPRHTVRLPFVPDRGRAAGTGVLWSGAEGLVRLEGETPSPLGGIRGLRDAALLEESAAIVAATASGLFALPTARDDTPGRRVDARGARLVAAGSGGGAGGVGGRRAARLHRPRAGHRARAVGSRAHHGRPARRRPGLAARITDRVGAGRPPPGGARCGHARGGRGPGALRGRPFARRGRYARRGGRRPGRRIRHRRVGSGQASARRPLPGDSQRPSTLRCWSPGPMSRRANRAW